MAQSALFPQLQDYIQLTQRNMAPPEGERLEALNELADYIAEKLNTGSIAQITFICTHNSRRSHLSQIWAQTAAAYYRIEGIHCFSGGTESTAFNRRAVETLRRAGFQISDPGGPNPRYSVHFSDKTDALICFSKRYDETPNPQKDFCAVMTCSHADKNCPIVSGADFRVSVPYLDPKEADDTPAEMARYDERSRQIAAEMLFLMRNVQKNLK